MVKVLDIQPFVVSNTVCHVHVDQLVNILGLLTLHSNQHLHAEVNLPGIIFSAFSSEVDHRERKGNISANVNPLCGKLADPLLAGAVDGMSDCLTFSLLGLKVAGLAVVDHRVLHLAKNVDETQGPRLHDGALAPLDPELSPELKSSTMSSLLAARLLQCRSHPPA